MPKGKLLSDYEKGAIVALKLQGLSNRAIARAVSRDEKTVRTYFNQKTAKKKKKRIGRPPKVSNRCARHIFRFAILHNQSSARIAARLPYKISKSTVLRALRLNKFAQYAKRKPVPALKPHHKIKRLAFAVKFAKKRMFWRRVLFTDEKKFNLDGPDGFRYYWRDLRGNSQLASKRVNGGGSVMVWAGVNYYGKTELVFLKGKQNAAAYIKTLQENAIPKLQELAVNLDGKQMIFQQDNASIHAAKATISFLKTHNVSTLEWPAKSPDFNIIENVWGLLARRVYAEGRQFDRGADLVKTIKQEWEAIEIEYIRKLVKSMPRRLEAARLLKGATTSY